MLISKNDIETRRLNSQRRSKNRGSGTIILSDEEIKQVEELAQTMNTQQIADKLGICRQTFFDIKNRQHEVEQAYRRGNAIAIHEISQSVKQRALTSDTLAIFFLKTKANWNSDKTEKEYEESVAVETQEEYQERVKQAKEYLEFLEYKKSKVAQ